MLAPNCSFGDGRRPSRAAYPILVLAALILSVCATVLHAGPAVSLLNGVRAYSLPAGATSVVCADVTRDGILDLVMGSGRGVATLPGNGDGTFGGAIVSDDDLNEYGIAVGDLNADGSPDVVAADYVNGAALLLIGNGDGSFQDERAVGAGVNPAAVAIADVNRDGKPDLLLADQTMSRVSILLGNGNGTFQIMTTTGTGTGPCAIAVGDLDGDHLPDLVTANWNGNGQMFSCCPGTLSVRYGNGDGTFGSGADYVLGLGPATTVAVGDLDRDGLPDLVATTTDADSVAVLCHDAARTFATPTRYPLGSNVNPTRVAIADLDHNLWPDLLVVGGSSVVLGGSSNTLSTLMNKADGTFGAAATQVVASNPNSIAAGRFDSDVAPDVAVACGGLVAVLTGRGDGTFWTVPAFATGSTPYDVAVADLDSDGHDDVVTANISANTVSVLRGRPGGTLGSKTDFATGSGPDCVAIGDLDRDGHPDLVTGNYYAPSTVSVLRGDGAGGFAPRTDYVADAGPKDIAICDLGGDAYPDVLVAAGNASAVSVLHGAGDGTLGTRVSCNVGYSPYALTTGDFDGDGRPDVATASHGLDMVMFLKGDGAGALGGAAGFSVGKRPNSIAAGDLDGDGIADVVVGHDATGDSNVTVLLRAASGVRSRKELMITSGSPLVRLADLDGDGRLDLVAGNSAGEVGVRPGQGDGMFGSEIDFIAGSSVKSLAFGDVDGDGAPDVITTGSGNTVFVLRNTGPLTAAVDRCAAGSALRFALGPAWPNPARGTVALRLVLPARCDVDAGVYDLAGRRVRGLTPGASASPGAHVLRWDGCDTRGVRVQPGIYLVRARGGGAEAVRRVVQLR